MPVSTQLLLALIAPLLLAAAGIIVRKWDKDRDRTLNGHSNSNAGT